MLYEVHIDMNNNSALITVAMLSSYLSNENRDYKDLISPFIIKLLPRKENKVIDLEKVQSGLHEEFGLEMPQKAIKSVLSRIHKKNKGKFKRDGKELILIELFNNESFKSKKNEMKGLIEKVVNSLLDYYKSNSRAGKYTYENARKTLIQFYKSYGYVLNDTKIAGLNGITKRSDRDNYPIARFILNEKEKQSTTYNHIIQITKGFFAYKAIYFFGRGNKESIETKLKGVSFYFDTPLLIDMLGYDREDEKKAANELRKLIILNGGKLKTFEQNKNELAGILTLYAKDKNVRKKLDLTFLRECKYDCNDAIRLRNSLEINLEKLAIKLEELPSYGVVTDENYKITGCIGIEEFTSNVLNCYKSHGHIPEKSNIEIDVNSIDAISRLRGGKGFGKIEKCKAIFITDNHVILKCARKLVEGYGVPLGMSSLDLAALLWLSKYNEQTNLPESLLIESAYAACSPTNELMNTFHEQIEKIEKEGGISNEEALLLRNQEAVTEELVDLTQNDSEQMNDDTVNEVLDRYNEKIKSVEKAEKEKALKELDEIGKIKQSKYKHATQKAEIAKKRIIKFSNRAVIFALVTIVCFFAYSILAEINIDGDAHWHSYVGLMLGILGSVDMCVSKLGVVKKMIKRNAQRRYDNVYAKEVEKIESYYRI